MYIYGIIEEKVNRSFGKIGIEDGSEVYTIPYKDLAVVVSDVPVMIYQPTVENVTAYEKVIRKVMETHFIIPMSFGMVASSARHAENILSIGYNVFRAMLEKIKNKVQIDLKVLWDKNKVYFDILNENERIRELTKKVDKSHEDKLELGKLVHQALDKKREIYIEEIKKVLSNFSDKSKENKLTNENMLLNLSYLVDKEKEKDFYDKVNEKERSYDGKLQVIAVGPLPPYNFTKLELKKLDFKSMDNARKVLGLGKEITLEELEEAHRALAYRYHPDLNPNSALAERKFKNIEKAYNILANYCKHYPNRKILLRKEAINKTILFIEKE
ncbi:MAG: GvpL/GvpF family gas vesicle protein [Candidatus Thermoplasmatota archaeon]